MNGGDAVFVENLNLVAFLKSGIGEAAGSHKVVLQNQAERFRKNVVPYKVQVVAITRKSRESTSRKSMP